MGPELQVEVRGNGIAAACCRFLLAGRGCRVSGESKTRSRVPAILLSPGTQELLQDVFEAADLLRGFRLIRRRVVAWGSESAVTVPHSGIIVSEEELLKRLAQLELQHRAPGPPDWTIHTGGPLPTGSISVNFGSRATTATRVRLRAGSDSEACVMESLREGWLFLLPTGDETALLLSAGLSVTGLLGESRIVQSNIDGTMDDAGSFPSHPRIADPLCGEHWLACGSAAIGFDPLCGDGAGNAIREAILACAVIGGCGSDRHSEELLWEYRLRLWRGFRRHIEQCLHFYQTGGQGEWWQKQCIPLREGLDWLDGLRAPHDLGTFQLKDFSLQRTSH